MDLDGSDEGEERGTLDNDDLEDGKEDLKYSADKILRGLIEDVVKEIAEIVEGKEKEKEIKLRPETIETRSVSTRRKSTVSDKQKQTADSLFEMIVRKMPKLRDKQFQSMDKFIIVPYFKSLGG